jgi:hypothetical protein
MKTERDYEVLWIDNENEVQMKSFDDEKSARAFIKRQESAGYEVEINW